MAAALRNGGSGRACVDAFALDCGGATVAVGASTEDPRATVRSTSRSWGESAHVGPAGERRQS